MITLFIYRYWEFGKEFQAPSKSVQCVLEIRTPQNSILLFSLFLNRWFSTRHGRAPKEIANMSYQIPGNENVDYVFQCDHTYLECEKVDKLLFKDLLKELNVPMTDQELFEFFCKIAFNEVIVQYKDMKMMDNLERDSTPLEKISELLQFEAEFIKGK